MLDSHKVYIGLGSNLGDRPDHIQRAIELLDHCRNISVVRVSDIIETTAVSDIAQPDFLNAAVEIKTGLNARELLYSLQKIESSLGRSLRGSNNPRTIDLDILLFDDDIIDESDLIVPHPRMHLRHFVLEPLANIASDMLHPVLNETVKTLAERLNHCSFKPDANRSKLICISGPIGIGKTTLAKSLCETLDGEIILEPYDTNPFIADEYAGHLDKALASEMYFLDKRTELIDISTLDNGIYICDHIFNKGPFFAKIWLDEVQLAKYLENYEKSLQKVAQPAIVLYMTGEAKLCLERIYLRNRPYEQHISLDFLNELNENYTKLFSNWQKSPVIRLSWPKFDSASESQIQRLTSQIRHYIL